MAVSTIIVLNDYCHVQGGASRVAIDEAVGLAESGFRVIFLGAAGPIGPELANAPLEVVCLDQPELVSFGKNPGVALQGLWNLSAKRAMEQILARCDRASTIVHLHGYTKALTTSPIRAAQDANFAILCTLHDFFPACPNGGFFDYVENQVCLRTALSPNCISTNCDKRHYAHKLYRVARSVAQRGLGHFPSGVKHFITLSNKSVEVLKPYLPDDAHYYPLENISEVPKRPPVTVAANHNLIYVGRLDPEKGVLPLLEAARLTGIPLTLVGDGPLRAAAEALPNVTITGWLSPEGVVAALDQARALVFPSLWYETYGLVVSEAAARGVPALVTDVSAASERVVDGIHGLVTPAGNVAALAEAMRRTAEDALVMSMGQAAYARFWDNPPTRQRHLDGLRRIYDRALAA